jgi:ABC-type multidrug transport system fused ATPase/permease subunit
MYFLYTLLGVAAIAGAAVLTLMVPVNAVLARIQSKYQREFMSAKDDRVRLTSETVQSIPTLKLLSWEAIFRERIASLRNSELVTLRQQLSLRALGSFLWYTTPILVSVVTFVLFTALGNDLEGAVVFPAIALFNVMRFPIDLLPRLITDIVSARGLYLSCARGLCCCSFFLFSFSLLSLLLSIYLYLSISIFLYLYLSLSIYLSLSYDRHHALDARSSLLWWSNVLTCTVSSMRIARFLCEHELQCIVEKESFVPADDDDDALLADGSDHQEVPVGGVSVRHGTFAWTEDADANTVGPALSSSTNINATLTDITLDISPGQLVVVVGEVGAGKSSLLSSLLGEMNRLQGRVLMSGRVAYVPQQTWIKNGTVRDNVVFAAEYDPVLYQEVIDACALGPDLNMLPAGDLTDIGENGISLSGGQV